MISDCISSQLLLAFFLYSAIYSVGERKCKQKATQDCSYD